MWLIFSGDCISNNLDLSLIIYLQGKHWLTVLMLGISDTFIFTIISGKTVAVTKRLEETEVFCLPMFAAKLIIPVEICPMTNWLQFCRAQLTFRKV